MEPAAEAGVMDQPAIAVEGLWKVFDEVEALRGLDLRLDGGGSLTIFGPNASGKTTLLKVLATLVRPTGGSVRIAGCDLERHPDEVRRRIGFLSHSPYLYPQLTAFENLTFYARLFGIERRRERAREALDRLGLLRRRDERVSGFSRGMQQRVAIARLLLHEPDILLLDEPSTGLDQEGTRVLREVLATARREGKTILLTTHQMDEGLDACDEAAIQVHGRLVFRSPVASLDRGGFTELYEETVRAASSAPRRERL